MKQIFAISFIFCIVFSSINALTIKELAELKTLSEYVSSPDGKYLVYTIKNYNHGTEESGQFLKARNMYDDTEFELTNYLKGQFDSNPVFLNPSDSLHDNSNFLLFLRNGSLWKLNISNNKPENEEIVKKFEVDLISFKTKSNLLVFRANTFPEFGSVLELTKNKNEELAKRPKNSFDVYTSLDFRFYNSWSVGKTNQLFAVKLSVNFDKFTVSVDGNVTNVSSIMKNSNEKFLDVQEDYDITTNNGVKIAFSSVFNNLKDLKNIDKNIDLIQNSQIYSFNANNIGVGDNVYATHLITGFNSIRNLTYSPNGKKIAFVSSENIYDGEEFITVLSNGLSTSFKNKYSQFTNLSWFNDFVLMFTINNNGRNDLAYIRLDLPNSSVVLLSANDNLSTDGKPIKLNKSNRIVINRSSINKPNNLFTLSMTFYSEGTKLSFTQITNLHPELKLKNFESVVFKNDKGKDIQGFVVFPLDFDEKKKYPVVVNVHGGPNSNWPNSWFGVYLNPQTYASDKIILLPNPTGSTGFGNDFRRASSGDWGGQPRLDILSFVEEISKRTYVEPSQKCIMGLSYGGYMTNWVRANQKRGDKVMFNCFITMNGIFDIRMSSYSSDIPFLFNQSMCKDNYKCRPYKAEDSANFDKFSPELLMKNLKTEPKSPHMVVHGQNDYRLTWSEGQALFTALQLNGIESKYLFFLEESHFLSRYKNMEKLNESIDEFLTKNISFDLK